MTQQVVHARVSFKSLSAWVDPPSNDFVFEATGSDTDLTMTEIDTWIEDFYNTTASGASHSIGHWMSQDLDASTNAAMITYYDVTAHLNGTNPGAPFRTTMFTLSRGTAGYAPGCAALIAYRRDYTSDPERSGATRPRARDRGRVYIGPLANNAVQASSGLLDSGLITDVEARVSLSAQTQNTGVHDQFNWVQWSRANASVDPIRWYFVPEAVCYQRRRADDTLNRVHSWIAVP